MASQKRGFKLTIKNVRGFAEKQHFDIRPLTFLIGANSTGKTTVMSCFSTIYNLISQGGFRHPDFNEKPYSMGAFVDIITRSKARGGSKNTQNFEIGIDSNNDIKYNFCFEQKKFVTKPIIKKANVDFKDSSFSCEEKARRIIFTIKNKDSKITSKQLPFLEDDTSLAWLLLGSKHLIEHLSLDLPEDVIFYEELKKLRAWTKKIFAKSPFSLAPVRSKPQRTYDPTKEFPSSEGSEVPIFLSNLKGKAKDWKKLQEYLITFGKTSGLFSSIEVSKKLGNTTAGPFQLQFKIRGIESNIIDTGYGLSQILPLLVKLFASNTEVRNSLKKGDTWFLLQQPEIHLHPEAQAELASLFVQSVKMNNSFLIETHSDYILKRTRIEIRNKKIDPDQVSIIYLEPVKDRIKVHNMCVDKNGNLIGAPTGYRKFFINETNRFLGFEN